MQNWKNISDDEFVSLSRWKTFRCSVQSISGSTLQLKILVRRIWQESPLCDQALARSPGAAKNRSQGWMENAFELLDQPASGILTARRPFIIKPIRVKQWMAETRWRRSGNFVERQWNIGNPLKSIHFEGIIFCRCHGWRPTAMDLLMQANVCYDASGDHMIQAGINFTFVNITFKITNCS